MSAGKGPVAGQGTRDQIARKQRAFSSNRSDTSEGARSSGPTDMDQWLDNVFDPILDGDLDELSDGRSLENRIRGGGGGVPGVSQVCTLYLGFYARSQRLNIPYVKKYGEMREK